MDKLWITRSQSLDAVGGNLNKEMGVIISEFEIIDEIVAIFHSQSTVSEFCFVTGLSLLNARNLAFGILSLELDGLPIDTIRGFCTYCQGNGWDENCG